MRAARQVDENERRQISWRQGIALVRIAQHPARELDTAAIRTLVGTYATNILQALLERGLVTRTVSSGWALTKEGHELARQLLASPPER